MNVDFIKNIGFLLLAFLLIVGGVFFLVSGSLHLSAYYTWIVYCVLAVLAIVSGGFIALGK